MPVFGPNLSGLFAQPTKLTRKFFTFNVFPERIRITGPGIARNFVLSELGIQYTPPYVIYAASENPYLEYYQEGNLVELYNLNTGNSVFSGQTTSFNLPSSAINGYTITTAHTTPTLAVTISETTQSKVYDGQQASLAFTSSPSPIELGEYLLSSDSNTPGTYTISLVEGSKTSRFIWGGPYPSVSYTITKRPVTLTMTDMSATYRPSGAVFGDVLSAPMAYNSPAGVGLISGSAQYVFSGLVQNLPPLISNAGTYTVSVAPNYTHPLYTISGYTNNKTTATLTITKATPTISFNPENSVTSGTSATLIASTSPVTLPVTFSIVSGGSFANITGGNTLNFTGAGTVVVRASTASSTNYNAASSSDRSITISAPASEGIPARITALSNTPSLPFGAIEVGKEYTSFTPLTGSQVELGGYWGWYNYVRSTTTIGGGTSSGDSFTSYLSKDIETYNGNRTLAYVILNPRHALIYHYENAYPKAESDTWVLAYIEGWSDENGDGVSASIVSTNPSSDPLNFPTTGWTNGFQPYVQLARDITVSLTRFYDIYNRPTHETDPYGGYYQGATPRVKVLQKQNRTPTIRDQANSWTDSLWYNFQPVNIRGGARMPVFYASLGYMYTEEPNIPWGGTRQLIFGYMHEFFHYGWPPTKALPFTAPITQDDYAITTLKNVWLFTTSGTYSHGDGAGYGFDTGTYYNVPSNTNSNVLPPALSPPTSPTWRMAGQYPMGFSANELSAYTPNYSSTPVADIITGSGSIYTYLNRDWVRINVGDAVGQGYSNVLFLKSGIAYQDLYSGYIMLAPNSVIGATELNETTVFPLSGGSNAFTCPSDKWKIIYSYYQSDYYSFDIYETWEATSSNANRVPQNFTGAGGNTNNISFAPKSFY